MSERLSEERPVCGNCGLHIDPAESGIRHYGFFTAHSENRCYQLLRMKLDEAHAKIERLTKTFGTVTWCDTCKGTGILPGGTDEYPASGCCPIGHSRICECRLCLWRAHAYEKDAEIERLNVELSQRTESLQIAVRLKLNAQEDTERLDWLEAQGDFVNIEVDRDLAPDSISIVSNKFVGVTLREAIDAARGQKEQG